MVGMSSVETDTRMMIVIKPIMVEVLIKERLNMQSNDSHDMVDESRRRHISSQFYFSPGNVL